MPTRNVELSEHLDRFIESEVNSGRYSDPSDLMRKALGELEQREEEHKTKLRSLEAAIKEGSDQIERGEGIEFASVQNLVNYLDAEGRRISAEFASERSGA